MMKKITTVKGSEADVVLYQAPGGRTSLEVRLKKETVWLSQRQMAELFDKDTDTIGLHIRNIFKEGELESMSTTEESSVVQNEGSRRIHRKILLYNLDVIISVGYRVKSKRGTQFRIWATTVLRDHLVKGYSANERRLRELRQSLRLVENVLERHDVSSDEAKALLRVVTDYAYALDVLDDYDHQRLVPAHVQAAEAKAISYKEAGKLFSVCARNSGHRIYSAGKRIRAWVARSTQSCRPSMERTYTRAWRKRQLICFTSL
jgi:hypothetical protein